MGNISDLEANISQMQQLLNAAQNDIQKKTFALFHWEIVIMIYLCLTNLTFQF